MSFLRSVPWSSHARDLIRKRYLPQQQEQASVSSWLRRVVSAISPDFKDRERYFELLHGRFFLPTSAALHNSVKKEGSLSGCMVIPLSDHPQDVIEHDVPKMTRVLMKGIGVGVDLSEIPPRLHPDSRTRRCHMGPNHLLHSITMATGSLVEYGGVKRAAYMGALKITHPNVTEFINLKQKVAIPTVNVSVTVDRAFKQALETNQQIPFEFTADGITHYLTPKTLALWENEAQKRGVEGPDLYVDADQTVHSRTLKALVGVVSNDRLCLLPKSMLRQIALSAHSCGDPGFLNLDAINRDNPTHPRFSQIDKDGVGEISVTTPCGEQPLLPYEVCHLGSFNLAAFTTPRGFNKPLFEKAIPIAVRLMDDLITASDNQLPEANRMAALNRKMGIGVMGLADALTLMDIPYDSQEAFDWASDVAKTLQLGAQKASEKLAEERGPFPLFPYSPFTTPRRHATLTTIAPTGHISTLAECSPSIEPIFKIQYDRRAAGIISHTNPILDQKLAEIDYSLAQWIDDTRKQNPDYQFDGTLEGLIAPTDRLKQLKQVFKTAGEIDPQDHLKMVESFQRYVDNGVSKTINLPNSATVEDVEAIFIKALDLKGITVFRDGSLEQQALYHCRSGVCEL